MRADELDFPLPDRLIALQPPAERAGARLLAVACSEGSRRHLGFRAFPDLLAPGDLLVVNDTRVIPARIVATKETGGRVEGLWLGEEEDGRGRFLISGSRLRPGIRLLLADGKSRLRLACKTAPGRWLVEDEDRRGWLQLLSAEGATPLPPYIRSRRVAAGRPDDSPEDRERYQTLFAARDGAVAAPTASLHFDAATLEAIGRRGVEIVPITLHVGAGTFQPVTTERVEDHAMHAERFACPAATLEALRRTRARGGRIVAAGTTVCRVLEHLGAGAWPPPGAPGPGPLKGETRIFLLPGHRFVWTDALLTNFHTPRSTLLALVAAFADWLGGRPGLRLVKQVYAEAVQENYRFFSYGDATFWSR